VGVKTEFFNGALTSTLAFFHLTKSNILTADLSTLDPTDQRVVGEQRSRGIELDISGQLSESISLIGSYAFTGTEVLEDPQQFDDGTGNIVTTEGNAGHRFANVPRHAGSLFAKYSFQEASLRGLSLGAGVFAASQRQGDLENSFQLPGYVRLDAFAAYEWKLGPPRITAQLNIENLSDKEYFESSNIGEGIPRFSVFPGAPLTVLGSIRLEY